MGNWFAAGARIHIRSSFVAVEGAAISKASINGTSGRILGLTTVPSGVHYLYGKQNLATTMSY